METGQFRGCVGRRVMGRSDRIQHKNRDREEGMEWKHCQEQGELIQLVIVGWGVRKREALKTGVWAQEGGNKPCRG